MQKKQETREILATVVGLYWILMETLYSTFKAASSSHEPSLCSFISTTGPPARLVTKLYNLLVDLDDPHWIILKSVGGDGWSPRKVERLFRCGMVLLGNVHMRLVETWEYWPWPLRHLRDPAASPAVKNRTKHRLRHTCSKCLEQGVTEPFFNAVGGAAGVVALRGYEADLVLVDRMFKRCKPSSQKCELGLGRMSSGCEYRSGGYVIRGQLCARPVVAEHASRWGRVVTSAIKAQNQASC
jgi:hypothetical protein